MIYYSTYEKSSLVPLVREAPLEVVAPKISFWPISQPIFVVQKNFLAQKIPRKIPYKLIGPKFNLGLTVSL